MFNNQRLSAAETRQITTPVLPMYSNDSSLYAANGVFVIRTKNDTIAFFNGSNDGFKAEIFYSVTNKRGLVFLTSSDRGVTMLDRLNTLTCGLEIQPLLKTSVYKLYPSPAFALLKIYRQKNGKAMYEAAVKMAKNKQLEQNTLNELGDIFIQHDLQLAQKVLSYNIQLFPESSLSHSMLGGVYFQMKQYDKAFKFLSAGKDLSTVPYEFENLLKEAEDKVKGAREKLLQN
jgi:tetratricopeptide (TPR) repeat protein